MRAACAVGGWVLAGLAVAASPSQAARPATGAATLSIVVHASAIVAGERQALLDLYATTNGASWTDKTNWLGAPGTECAWVGVACDDAGATVQSVNLPSNNLVGTLPLTLGGLTNLQVLALSGNQIAGPIPLQLGNLANLQTLWLNGNSLTGSIPSQLGNLANLVNLDLGGNQLTGSIPSQLGTLGKLQSLSLYNNQLSGSIPSQLGSLPNLQFLYLSANQLTGSIPYQFGSLSKVQFLWMSGNRLSGSIPTQLGGLPNLQQLDLGANQLTGPIPAQLGSLANLQDLSLYGNQLTGAIPTQLGSLANLQNLQLFANRLTGSIPTQLGSLANLFALGLEGNQLTGSIPSTLGALANLQYLDLDTNQLTGPIPPELGGLTSLRGLYLHTNQLTGSIPPQLGSLANLTYLQLFGNQLSGPIPPQLGGLANLQVLELYGNLLTGPIPVELGNLANLQALSLDGNRLTGSIPPALGGLANLIALRLSGNQLTGPIPSELGNLSLLRNFNVKGNMLSGEFPVSFEGLTELVAGQSDLSYNALHSSNATLAAFMNQKQIGGNWQASQTVAPAGVATGATTDNAVALSWTPIAYSGDSGGYQALYSTTSGGPYTASGTTADKTASTIVVGGLNPASLYYFVVRTVTNPNANNANTVTSELSAEVYTATTGGACTAPAISSQPHSATVRSGQTTTLTVTATGSAPLSYHWYQGSTGDTSNPVGANANTFTTPALTATTSFWVRVSNSCDHADSATATVTVTSTYEIWVPVASHNPGKNQSQWRSDLGLLNAGTETANVQLTFYGDTGVVGNTTSVPPQTQSILVDVVNQIPAVNSGAIRIVSDQPLKITARSYNQVSSASSCYANGTQGQDYPAVAPGDGLAATESAYLGGLSENPVYRSNIGVVNTGTESATVLVELFDGVGTKLADYPVTLVAGQWAQETQPFLHKANQTAMDRGYAKVTVQSGSGVFAFASVIDGVTNDPTTVTMARSAPVQASQVAGEANGVDAAGASEQGGSAGASTDGTVAVAGGPAGNPDLAAAGTFDVWVPVASHNPGKNQSRWRSDLGLLNGGTATANVQITFYGDTGVVSNTTSVPPQTQSILADVVNQIPAVNSGALEVRADQPLYVTARSYNLVSATAACYPNGTQGQDYPAVVTGDGLAATESAYLGGLSENPVYRCNIGVVNTSTESATVLVELFDGEGAKLADYPVTLVAGQWAQETQPFLHKANQTAMDRGYAKVTVQSGSGVFAFASVIDGVTNDPTTVTMQR